MPNVLRRNLLLIFLLVFSICIDLAWHSYVGLVRDDAYITYRYAENIANGEGFVYNAGEHVYGTSSPGFALLLAAWLKVFRDPVIGSLGLDILASLLALFLVWKLLEHTSLPVEQRAVCLFILIWSDRLLLHLMEGMELPLVVSCMLAALYFMVKEKPIAAGVSAGWMLWLRLDSALWIMVIAFVFLLHVRRSRRVVVFLLITGLIYLPWLIFAQLYFGSVIPLTAIAKQAAYAIGEQPWTNRFMVLYGWLAPFTILDQPVLARIFSLITISVAAFGFWVHRRIVFVQVVALFFVLQSAAVIILNMTVEQRYMIYSLYALLVLFGMGLMAILSFFSLHRNSSAALLLVYATGAFSFASPRMEIVRANQYYVNNITLTAMGKFLKQSSPADSVVFLEPLGYVGYYSERRMLDAVGLATPAMVPLIRERKNWPEIIDLLKPDYLVLHCDDARRLADGFGYELVIRSDPLNFESGVKWENGPAVQRNACYEIDARNSAE